MNLFGGGGGVIFFPGGLSTFWGLKTLFKTIYLTYPGEGLIAEPPWPPPRVRLWSHFCKDKWILNNVLAIQKFIWLIKNKSMLWYLIKILFIFVVSLNGGLFKITTRVLLNSSTQEKKWEKGWKNSTIDIKLILNISLQYKRAFG